MDISTLSLARAQFVASLSFLAFFLAFSLALAWVLLFFKIRARWSGHGGWTAAYRFWVRIFALAFVLTLAASVPVLIQLGSLWAGLMDKIGNVAGPLLGYGILSVFILKSCFLGVMLFGQRRVSDGAHTLAVLMVAVVGVPDPVRTEIVKAFVLPKRDIEPTPALAAEIQDFVKDRLAAYQYPRAVEFVAELPMTATGKIRRKDLRDREIARQRGD